MVHPAADGRLGQHARGFLEGGRRDERVGGERGFGDSEQQRNARGGLAALREHPLVFLPEPELVHLLFQQEGRVPHLFHLHPAHHLADNDLDVFVVDVDSLQPVHLLDLIHQVRLEFLFTEHGQNVVRVAGAVHQRFPGADALPFLHAQVDAARQRVFPLGAVVIDDDDLALALGDIPIFYGSVDLGDHSSRARPARLKQLHHARQPAGDVLGFGGLPGDFRQHVSREDLIILAHHQVGPRGHQVLLRGMAPADLLIADDDGGLALFVRRVRHDPPGQPGDLVHLFFQGRVLLEVFELHGAAHLGEDGEGVGVPLDQDLPHSNRLALAHLEARPIHHRIPLALAPLFVNHRQVAVAVHDDVIALLIADGRDVD